MNCTQAQDRLLQAEAGAGREPELAAHMAGCPACSAFAAKLDRLELAARSLSVPADDGAKERFLEQLRARPAASSRRLRLWPMTPARLAIAAALLVGLAVGMWFLILNGQTPIPAGLVMDRLVDLNLQLVEADQPSQRSEIYAAQAAALQRDVARGKLGGEDRVLAAELLDSATWLCSNNDPLAEAERFGRLSEMLLARTQAAAAAGNHQELERLSRNYAFISAKGFQARLQRAQAIQALTAERKKRLQALLGHDAELEKRLDKILAETPLAPRRAILRGLGILPREVMPPKMRARVNGNHP